MHWGLGIEPTSILRSGSNDLTVVASANPPATITTTWLVGLFSVRFFESSRAKYAVYSSTAMQLDQSDVRGTDEWPWPWLLFRGRLRSCQPLRHNRHWISRKPLEIGAWFQKTTNRKWPTKNQMVTWPMMSRDPKGQGHDRNAVRVNISKTAEYAI